ncbi:unnamed protein product [Phaeothamnion confervicola]
MLTGDDFSGILWDVLKEAHGTPEGLRTTLMKLDKEEIAVFYTEFLHASSNLRASSLNSHLVTESDDVRKDTYEFIVAQGKDFYDDILNHPERCPQDVDSNDVWVKGIAIGVYWDRFHEHIPRYDSGEIP